MKARKKGIYKVEIISVNEYDKEKNFVMGEWYHKTISVFGVPVWSRTNRRDTNAYMNRQIKKTIGFNNIKVNDSK